MKVIARIKSTEEAIVYGFETKVSGGVSLASRISLHGLSGYPASPVWCRTWGCFGGGFFFNLSISYHPWQRKTIINLKSGENKKYFAFSSSSAPYSKRIRGFLSGAGHHLSISPGEPWRMKEPTSGRPAEASKGGAPWPC